ncbi:PREDICTED: cysteine-rich receptor-like protein kinase 10 [Ipomoea nil]|uniref:cysteine-rich receptor-like protein kinase 10 n=1 Tax=Ipomoea nil TaxID=35883 RepID=UPI000901104D|nr:PREDICTED: cysteine-rich receptor-like protein kinase 10 [Ipomoea nil]
MTRIFGIDQTQAETNYVVGTYGNISPEYVMQGQFSEKSNAWENWKQGRALEFVDPTISASYDSLKVVSNDLTTPIPALKEPAFVASHYNVNANVSTSHREKEGRPLEFVNPTIRELCDSLKVIWCIEVRLLYVQTIPTDRPTMSNVVHLCTDHATSIPPLKEPAFIASHSNVNANVSTSHRECACANVFFSSTSLQII